MPRGKPLRYVLLSSWRQRRWPIGLSQFSAADGVREIAVQQALPSAE